MHSVLDFSYAPSQRANRKSCSHGLRNIKWFSVFGYSDTNTRDVAGLEKSVNIISLIISLENIKKKSKKKKKEKSLENIWKVLSVYPNKLFEVSNQNVNIG